MYLLPILGIRTLPLFLTSPMFLSLTLSFSYIPSSVFIIAFLQFIKFVFLNNVLHDLNYIWNYIYTQHRHFCDLLFNILLKLVYVMYSCISSIFTVMWYFIRWITSRFLLQLFCNLGCFFPSFVVFGIIEKCVYSCFCCICINTIRVYLGFPPRSGIVKGYMRIILTSNAKLLSKMLHLFILLLTRIRIPLAPYPVHHLLLSDLRKILNSECVK